VAIFNHYEFTCLLEFIPVEAKYGPKYYNGDDEYSATKYNSSYLPVEGVI